MAIGQDAGKASMAGMYDVTNLKIGKHEIQDYIDHVNYAGIYIYICICIYSTAQILKVLQNRIAHREKMSWFNISQI